MVGVKESDLQSVCAYCLKGTSVQSYVCHPHVHVSIVMLQSSRWGGAYNGLVIVGEVESGSSARSLHSLPWSVSFTPYYLFGRWTSGSSFDSGEARGTQSGGNRDKT